MKKPPKIESVSKKRIIGKRFLGAIIDIFVVIPVTFWLFFISFQIGLIELGSIAYVFGAISFLVVFFFYNFLLEGWLGQTIGKIIVGLIVVKEKGEKCTYKASLYRNLIRIFPDAILFYLIGLTSIIFSEKHQRLGDKAAHTLVIEKTDNH